MQTPWRDRAGRTWRMALLVALMAATSLGVRPAFAQVDGSVDEEFGEVGENEVESDFFVPEPVDQLVVLPGSCPTAAPIEPGFAVDCFFEIMPGVDTAMLRYADVLYDGISRPCQVEAGVGGWDRLVCPDLFTDRFEDGPVSVDLRIEGEVAEAAAAAVLTWGIDSGFTFFGDGEGESVVFDGRPLRWFSYSYEPVDDLFMHFRERNGAEIVDSVRVELGEVFESADGSVAPGLPPGRYRMWPCVGATADSCEELPGGRPFQVIDGEPLELVEGHNRPSADRINVLFVSSGLERAFEGDPSSQLPALARTMLTIDGPYGLDFDLEIVEGDARSAQLLWGPMAIEPLASNLDRFNFWYLPDEIADEVGMLFGGLDRGGDAGFDLPNLQITALYNDGFDLASDARRTSFESIQRTPVPARGQLRFGDARVWVPTFAPLSGATTLAHEWGHGLFGLRDEYYGFDGRGISEGFPNCAPDLETAETWWGGVIGDVDPFVEHVLQVQAERLEDAEFVNADLAERTAIAVTAGGCYSDAGSDEVYRPSADSLMNSEVPVFGVVNRARVQDVLDRFSGRGPMESLEDLSMSCEGLRGFVVCRGELRSHLDKPLSILAIDSIPCEFGAARADSDGGIAPVPVTCSTTGWPSNPVTLSFKGERVSLDVLDVNPPPPPVEPRRAAAELGALDGVEPNGGGVASQDSETNRTVAVGVLLGVAALALAFVERRRRSREPSGDESAQ